MQMQYCTYTILTLFDHPYNFGSPFLVLGVSIDFLFFYCILHRYSCKKSVDPDQTPRSAAPELGLHCSHTEELQWLEH